MNQPTIEFSYKIYKGILCPIIGIEVKGPNGWIEIEAYVDTGAFISIFTVKEAQDLGLDYQKGKQGFATVGDGSLIPVYFHYLPIKIGSFSLKATIGFSPRLGVFNLLSRKDIFNRFIVTFDDVKRIVTFLPRRT